MRTKTLKGINLILGQEAICPDGLGRVSGWSLRPHTDIVWRLRVQTYINDRSCEWDPNNVELINPRG